MFYNVTELKISHANSPIHKAILENNRIDVLNLYSANAVNISRSMHYIPRILDQQSEEGLTPLQLASIIGDQSMFDLLVDIGANITHYNKSSPHHSPYDIAKSLANNYRSKANKIESEKSAGFEYLDCKEYQEANKQARDHEILINYLDKIIPAELKNIDYRPPLEVGTAQLIPTEVSPTITEQFHNIADPVVNTLTDLKATVTGGISTFIYQFYNKAESQLEIHDYFNGKQLFHNQQLYFNSENGELQSHTIKNGLGADTTNIYDSSLTDNCFSKQGDRLDITASSKKDGNDLISFTQTISATCNGVDIAKQKYTFSECDASVSVKDCLSKHLNDNLTNYFHSAELINATTEEIQIGLNGEINSLDVSAN